MLFQLGAHTRDLERPDRDCNMVLDFDPSSRKEIRSGSDIGTGSSRLRS